MMKMTRRMVQERAAVATICSALVSVVFAHSRPSNRLNRLNSRCSGNNSNKAHLKSFPSNTIRRNLSVSHQATETLQMCSTATSTRWSMERTKLVARFQTWPSRSLPLTLASVQIARQASRRCWPKELKRQSVRSPRTWHIAVKCSRSTRRWTSTTRSTCRVRRISPNAKNSESNSWPTRRTLAMRRRQRWSKWGRIRSIRTG